MLAPVLPLIICARALIGQDDRVVLVLAARRRGRRRCAAWCTGSRTVRAPSASSLRPCCRRRTADTCPTRGARMRSAGASAGDRAARLFASSPNAVAASSICLRVTFVIATRAALVLAGLERRACALFEQRVQRPGGIGPAIVEHEPRTVARDAALRASARPSASRGAPRRRPARSTSACSTPSSMPERPCADVVGRLGGRRRGAPHFRVGLLLEDVLRVASEDLRHRHDERACRVLPAVRLERRTGTVDVDARHLQLLDEMRRFVRIVLGFDRNRRSPPDSLSRRPRRSAGSPRRSAASASRGDRRRCRAAPWSRSARSRRCRAASSGRPSTAADTRCAG